MSFVFDIGGKKRATARFISLVRRRLIEAIIKAENDDGITRADIARKIGCHRSRVTRQLRGNSDLTLRSISEISWAIGMRPIFELENVVPDGVHVNEVRSVWEGEPEEVLGVCPSATNTAATIRTDAANAWQAAVLCSSQSNVSSVRVTDK